MESGYDPKLIEDRIYAEWMEKNFFRAVAGAGEPYCITIPPPNITGSLHIGHALNHSILDTMTRWHRMRGFNALCLPGTDHAGIGTQNVVERELAKEGLTRHDLGREKFIDRCWEWKGKYGDQIILQLHKLGCSYDWSRARFTMDDSYVDAIHEEFIRWFDRGLIYRGTRVVNWCPRCQSAISDIEVDSEERPGKLYHFRYPFTNLNLNLNPDSESTGHITIATTRPETLLGDTAVAVNPADERYAHLIGQMIKLPLTDREIPLIADDYAKIEFGTGAVKVTPAHDLDDFEAGVRNNLPQVVVIGEDGTMTEAAGPRYAGLDRFEARDLVVRDMEAAGFLEKIEDYVVKTPLCDRCGTVLEPLLSEQWFARMSPELAEPAIRAVTEEKIRFFPERYKKIYLDWMEKIRPWCISRQLWWGHRIPVWWTEDRRYTAARTIQEAAQKLEVSVDSLRQDEDVLDTWFSSALWPHATLGWPRDTDDLRYWYPTNLLSTAQEILYLWVARMIMTGLDFVHRPADDRPRTTDGPTQRSKPNSKSLTPMDRASEFDGIDLGNQTRAIIPFRDVYVHATVLDERGDRMSKSKGNGIDPLEMIDKYGADALRFALLQQAGKNQDIRFSEERIKHARFFCNKLWNAARFVTNSIETVRELRDAQRAANPPPPRDTREKHSTGSGTNQLPYPDRWIMSRLYRTIDRVNSAMTNYDMDEAARAAYAFFWDDYCDWYLEICKPRFRAGGQDSFLAEIVVSLVLNHFVQLIHPMMPFITEEIWRHLPDGCRTEPLPESLMFDHYPESKQDWIDAEAEERMDIVMETVRTLRNLRAELGIPPGPKMRAAAVPGDRKAAETLSDHAGVIESLARLDALELRDTAPSDGKWVGTPYKGAEAYLDIGDALDIPKELERLGKEIAKIGADLKGSRTKLENPQFTERAPAEIVEKERQYTADLEDKKSRLEARQTLLH